MTEPMNINMAWPVSSQLPDLFKTLLACWLGCPLLPSKPCQKYISLKQQYIVVSHIFLAFLDSNGQFSLGLVPVAAAERGIGLEAMNAPLGGRGTKWDEWGPERMPGV